MSTNSQRERTKEKEERKAEILVCGWSFGVVLGYMSGMSHLDSWLLVGLEVGVVVVVVDGEGGSRAHGQPVVDKVKARHGALLRQRRQALARTHVPHLMQVEEEGVSTPTEATFTVLEAAERTLTVSSEDPERTLLASNWRQPTGPPCPENVRVHGRDTCRMSHACTRRKRKRM